MITDAQVEAAVRAFEEIGCDLMSCCLKGIPCACMRAALEAAQLAAWQPIETAPKTGHDILIVNQGLVLVAFWDEARGGIWSIWPGREKANPTHWMPPPPVP